jgi:hypothetical protein
MARWKVTAKHYIHAEQYGQPTEWERQETNQQTGRMFRKAYKVPMFIDPEDPFCINRLEGFCVVARPDGSRPGDIIFTGPPTMDMEPLDAEAQAETDAEKHKWVNPIDSLPAQIGADFGKFLEENFLSMFNSTQAKIPQNASLKGASSDEVSQLREMVARQQEMLDKILKAQAPKQEPLFPDIDKEPEAPPPIPVNKPKPSTSFRRI